MNLDKIIVAGRADGCLVITLKESFNIDPSQLCIVVNLLSGELSDYVTIEQIEQVFPFYYVESATEEEILLEFLQELLPDQKLQLLIDTLVNAYNNSFKMK